MRSHFLISALIGLAVAIPRPQEIDFEGIDREPTPTEKGPAIDAEVDPISYNSTVEATAIAQEVVDELDDKGNGTETRKIKRTDTCDVPEPNGNGPKPPVDTVPAFLGYALFRQLSTGAPTPAGYVRSYFNKQASSNANSYMGLHTLDTYDPAICQAFCDAADLCTGFNLYFERDPTVNPADNCRNPPSFTNIKCTLWGSRLTPETAVNRGQYRRDFQVVITGSNGYTKKNPPGPQPGFDGPVELAGAINAPFSYVGMKYSPGVYDAGKCAAACTATTGYNSRHPRADGTYDACNFFNAYLMLKDGVPDGTYCSLYSQSWTSTYATNLGQTRGNTNYVVVDSYAFTRSPPDPGHI